MSAPAEFSYDAWKSTIVSASANLVDVNDNLRIDFNEAKQSTTCDIKISNLDHSIISTPILRFNPFVFEIKSEPELELIPPFGSVFYSVVALHDATTRSTIKPIKFVFDNGYTITRTVRINFSNDAEQINTSRIQRKRRIFEVPDVFVEAKRPTLKPLETFNAIDCLVPSYEELMYLNYDAHFHGLLYLEELNLVNLYKRFQKTGIYFRENGMLYDFDYVDLHKPAMGIGKYYQNIFRIVKQWKCMGKTN